MTPGLIERLEAAGEGSRELDYAIEHWLEINTEDEYWKLRVAADWTTSLDAALALAERVLPGWYAGVQPWFHTDPDRAMHRAYVVRPDWARWNPVDDDWCECIWGRSAATPALAVCIAILKARATQEQETLSRTKANRRGGRS